VEKQQEIVSYGMDLIGMGGNMLEVELTPMTTEFQDSFLFAPVSQVAGGTNEIMRNIIAERVLGLPADIRVDKKCAV
jgi:alkylation response protein AidB-like acyl-CoA dehydrogenase|tara:strand:+ start:608 stop:838 length:231 start_codon:yes stop_codon:yes gene_type:complete